MARRRKEKKNKSATYAAIAFIAIMVLSVVGLFAGGSGADNSSVRYGDYKFDLTSRGWISSIDGENRYFDYAPLETLALDLDPVLVNKLRTGPIIYLTSAYNDSFQGEIAATQLVLAEAAIDGNIVVGVSFTDYSHNGAPTLDCTNATSSVPVILFQEGDATSIVEENNCYTFTTSSTYDLALFRTRMQYEYLGIEITEPEE